RLFPVPLVEAVWTAAITLIACGFLGGAPGGALLFWLAGYGSARFVLEFIRGDPGRPRMGPLSEAQLLALALLPGCVGLDELRVGWQPLHLAAIAAALTLPALGWASRRWWFSPPPPALDESTVAAWCSFLTRLDAGARGGGAAVRAASPSPEAELALR